jgi:hypothetical protein
MQKLLFIAGSVYLFAAILTSCKKEDKQGTASPMLPNPEYYIKYTIDGVSDSASCVNFNNFCYYAYQASVNNGDSAVCPSYSYVGAGSSGVCIKTTNYDVVNLSMVLPCDSSIMTQNLIGKKSIIKGGLGLPLVYPFSEVFQLNFKFSNSTECYNSMLDTLVSTYFNEITDITYQGRTVNQIPYFSVSGKFTCKVSDSNNVSNIKNLTGAYRIAVAVKSE